MKKQDRWSGSILFLLAVILFFQSRKLSFWGDAGPSEGFFPLVLSILLGLFSVTIFLRAGFPRAPGDEIFRILGPKKGKLLSYVGSFLAFGLIFTKLGFSLSLTGFLVLILKFTEKLSWRMTLTITVASVIISLVLFKLLQVAMPEGFLAPVFDRLR